MSTIIIYESARHHHLVIIIIYESSSSTSHHHLRVYGLLYGQGGTVEGRSQRRTSPSEECVQLCGTSGAASCERGVFVWSACGFMCYSKIKLSLHPSSRARKPVNIFWISIMFHLSAHTHRYTMYAPGYIKKAPVLVLWSEARCRPITGTRPRAGGSHHTTSS